MADFAVQEFFGDFEVNKDSINYSGAIGMSATVVNKHGEQVTVGYDVDVDASVSVDWETDEQPTGWNYGTDQPTYTSSTYAVASDVSVTSVSFTEGQEFYIDNEVYSLHDAQSIIDPSVLKQLLNPTIYASLMAPSFDRKAEDIEPEEEPDYFDDFDMHGDY